MALKYILFGLFLSYTVSSFAQKKYRKFRDSLDGLTCGDTNEFVHAQKNVPLLLKYIGQHPKSYDAYYDLGMEYITLAEHDTSGKISQYWTKGIESFKSCLHYANRKRKLTAYQNLAVIYFYLGDCEKVKRYLKKGTEIVPKKQLVNWKQTTQFIRDHCIDKEN